MLDHQAARRIRQGAHSACALIAAAVALLGAAPAARAQVNLPGVTPPVVAPGAPGPDTLTLAGDAAHRNAWTGTGLRPPLELAWAHDGNPLLPPLAAGSRVIVETATALTAYNAADGAALWNVALASPAELATDSRRVFLAGTGGVAALDIATGATDWAVPGRPAAGPVVADGRLLVGTTDGHVTAYQADSGSVLWTTATGIVGSRPAIAGSRAYVTGTCRAAAITTTTGLPIWATGSCTQSAATRTLLGGGFVFAEDGAVYAAADGARLADGPSPGTIGGGLVFRSPLAAPTTVLAARDAGTFAPRWTWTPPLAGGMLLRPAVVDGAVYQVVDTGAEGLLLGALETGTGRELWSAFLPAGSSGVGLAPGIATTVTAAGGLLLVPTDGGGLAALRNAAAGPLGVTASLPRNVVAAGTQTVIKGTLTSDGHGLVGPRPVTLEADRFPYDGDYEVLDLAIPGRAGFSFTATVARNTRFRLTADGVTYSPTEVFAQPALSIAYTATRRRLIVLATLRIKAQPGLRRRGGRVAVYRLKRRGRVAKRLGAGRSSAGGTARFRVHIPRSLKRSDRILTCLRGARRQGFGAPNVLDSHCGDRRIRIPQAASASARRSLSTGTGSPMPLKRLWPASEKA